MIKLSTLTREIMGTMIMILYGELLYPFVRSDEGRGFLRFQRRSSPECFLRVS